MVDMVKSWRNEEKKRPKKPPKKPSSSDSSRKAPSMLLLRNPSALKVPISLTLFATAAYIVIIAPIMAPRENIIVRDMPRILRNFAIISDCFS